MDAFTKAYKVLSETLREIHDLEENMRNHDIEMKQTIWAYDTFINRNGGDDGNNDSTTVRDNPRTSRGTVCNNGSIVDTSNNFIGGETMYRVIIMDADGKERKYTLDKWSQVVSRLKQIEMLIGIQSASIENTQLKFTVQEKTK